jgi:hypothetical protein
MTTILQIWTKSIQQISSASRPIEASSYATLDQNFLLFFFQQPFHCEIEHKIGLTCWSQGPVLCRVRLDRGGYVPGEAISIWATITNNSKVNIKHTRASLTEVRTKNHSTVLLIEKTLSSLY